MSDPMSVSFRMRDRANEQPTPKIAHALVRRWADEVAALEARLSKMEEAAHLAIDDIRDALQSNEYSDAVTITVALDLCLEAREALAGE